MAKKKKPLKKGKSTSNGSTPPDNPDNKSDSPKAGGKLGLVLPPIAGGLVAFATVFLFPTPNSPSVDMSTHMIETAPEAKKIALGIPEHLEILQLDEITLSIGHERQQLLRIGLALEIDADKYDYVDPSDPRFRDAALGYLRAIQITDLQDPAFFPHLREQLLRRARLIMGQDIVYNVLVTDFLVK